MRARIAFVVSISIFTARHAHADAPADKQKCLAAYVAGQDAREKGHLRDARVEFETCGQDACPTAARKDCVEWLAQVTASLPSVVVASADDEGKDIPSVTVTLDGQPFALSRDGRAVPVDPGPHTFKFEAQNHEPQTVELVILEGQKNRLVTAKLPRTFRPKPITERPLPPPPPTTPVLPFVTGGVAVVALGFFVGFAASGVSDMNALEAGCGKTQSCKQEDVDDARGKLIVGDVLLAVALLAGGATAYLLLR